MKLRHLVVVVALSLCAVAAQAQVGVYLNPVFNHISTSTADTGTFAFLGPNVTSRMFYGLDIGGYYDFFHGSKFNGGVDIRDVITHGNNAELKSFLVGARLVAAKPLNVPVIPFKPYVQASIGVGSSHAPDNALNISKVQYGIFVGADHTLAKHVDWRIAEIGYGSVTTVSSQTVGGTVTNLPSDSVLSLSTGFVFRFR
jgi:hypothetical protein